MPLPLLVGAVALSAVGTFMSVSAAQASASANRDIAASQQQANQISLRAMEVESRRRQLETIRQGQIAKSQSTAVATAQNAQLGSGLQGGIAQVSGEQNFNLLGLNQNLDLGKEMASVNNRISQDRMSLASAQGLAGWGAGFSGFGNTLTANAGAITRLSGGSGSA